MARIRLPVGGARRRGRRIALSPQRRFVCDLLHFAHQVPSVPSQRRMRLADVIAARGRHVDRISWCAIFIKAYAIVAANRPELRRCYMPWIVPHLYEHPINVASFTLERLYGGEEGVFHAKIVQPERRSLQELDRIVRWYKSAPVETVASFCFVLWISRLPRPLRRLCWMVGLFSGGARRADLFGTFGVSVVGALGAAGLHILSPLTTTLNYGTFTADGSLDVRVTYDHRVLDGAPVARALAELEEVLHTEIRRELLELADEPQAAFDPVLESVC